MAKNKTDSFLKAIKKYSELERQRIEKDIAEIKEEQIQKAKAESKKEADSYINRNYSSAKSAIIGEYSVKQLEATGRIYEKRKEITAGVFEEAKKKLIEFTATDRYGELLIAYAGEIADKFKDKSCVVYVKNEDMKYAEKIRSVFDGEVSVEADSRIKIGGLSAECKSLRMVADNTLDSRLEQQIQWFTENSQLNVM